VLEIIITQKFWLSVKKWLKYPETEVSFLVLILNWTFVIEEAVFFS